MNGETETVSDTSAATRIWFFSWLVINAAAIIAFVVNSNSEAGIGILIFGVASFFCSIPALIILLLTMRWVKAGRGSFSIKIGKLCLLVLTIAALYGSVPFYFVYTDTYTSRDDYIMLLGFIGILFAASVISILLNIRLLKRYLGYGLYSTNQFSNISAFLLILKTSIMHQNPTDDIAGSSFSVVPVSNTILIKSVVTAVLILIMLVPTSFIQSLITEREDRQKEVVEEVSSKWALPQTVSAPYLVVPYTDGGNTKDKKNLVVLPEQLNVNGSITEENRPRSIYKVLLYKSKLNFSGNFHPVLNTADSAVLLLNEAKLCFGLSDFRGIEDKLSVSVNNNAYTLLPGLPDNSIDSTGLSVPVSITAGELDKGINFNMDISLRGSGGLHFLPLGSYSNFNIQSSWPGPSFDGNTLPAERKISDSGFLATWKFNAANLPFTSVIKDAKINTKGLDFGVSLVQPADQYVKSMRSAKYAILIIGLTFVLFFVFELMQKKPVHPVQYMLVGMALVIFYTLLVSISEMILFDYAYTIAAVATIVLISLYAKSHFKTWRSAIIFALLLSGLYGFIYVLISLEDTALLVGSIALFIVVAVIMYVTRKINWYQPEPRPALNIQP